jgi:hypothetical protein
MMQHGLRCELQTDRSETHDLLDIANVRLALLNPRRNPPFQEFWITFDIGGKIKHLLALRVQQSNFHDYRPMRINETPVIDP